MKNGLLLLVSVFSLCCHKTENSIPAGTYTGTFCRKFNAVSPSANVTIHFTGSSYTGDSDSSHYPAICSGLYGINGDSITVVPSCAFPADFDWTLIFQDHYRLTLNGDSLYMRRVVGDFVYEEDIYSLKKQ